MIVEMIRLQPSGWIQVRLQENGGKPMPIAHAAFESYPQAKEFAATEAFRRGWSLVNKVDDDLPSQVTTQAQRKENP